jgi:cytochrome c oxidase subunit IV
MTIAGSIFLMTVGAILYFATNFRVSGVEVDTIGLILMIAGAAGLIIGLFLSSMWTRRGGREVLVDRREAPVVEERREPPPPY